MNCRAKVSANSFFKRALWEYVMAIPGQSAKLNVRQSVFVAAKLPNVISAKCTASMV